MSEAINVLSALLQDGRVLLIVVALVVQSVLRVRVNWFKHRYWKAYRSEEDADEQDDYLTAIDVAAQLCAYAALAVVGWQYLTSDDRWPVLTSAAVVVWIWTAVFAVFAARFNHDWHNPPVRRLRAYAKEQLQAVMESRPR